ncbi:MAG: rRNA maturation RNase YbeY [Sulfitobacter sp.]
MEALEVVIESALWEEAALLPLVRRAVVATLEHIQLDAETCEVVVLACDDARIAELNTEFRGKPTPTNVLSWPAQPLAPASEGQAPPAAQAGFDGMVELGDIALSHETCATEAHDSGKPFDHHLTHLIVHGVLHLLGYDHVQDGDAVLMERLEVEILGNLDIDDPYNMHETLTDPAMGSLPKTGPNGRH